MTIIEPNKNKFKIKPTVFLVATGVIAGVLLNIYFYNLTVDLRYRLGERQSYLEKLQVANADFKNQLYEALDVGNFTELAGQLGLVKENKPEYIELRDLVVVASRQQ